MKYFYMQLLIEKLITYILKIIILHTHYHYISKLWIKRGKIDLIS